MEQNLAILLADLSGYTALTETHGAGHAADLVDKYISIAGKCLASGSRLHERTGDEIMIVSDSADSLLSTAINIGIHTSKEEHFLQVHGGLHFGPVLQRGAHYFGTAINLSSRIASKAAAGSFWCSADFVKALSNPSLFDLRSKGSHFFKNINKEKEIFELAGTEKHQSYTDPVCRMLILDLKKAITLPGVPGIYFCSHHCSKTYSNNRLK
jgi:adenylate cyclase